MNRCTTDLISRRFVACGDRGVLLESVDGRAWKTLDAALGDARNFLWFSRVVPGADGLLLSGATLGAIRGGPFHLPCRRVRPGVRRVPLRGCHARKIR